MAVLKRSSELLNVDISHLLDSAADPGTTLDELIRELEESIVALQREEADAVARQKRLMWRIMAATRAAGEYETRASRAFELGDERLARRMEDSKVACRALGTTLADTLERSTALAARLQSQRLRMRDRVHLARRRRQELENGPPAAAGGQRMSVASEGRCGQA